MIRLKTLPYKEAHHIITDYDNLDDIAFDDLTKHWSQYDTENDFDESYAEFRQELIKVFDEGRHLLKDNKKVYMLDLKLGLKLYQLLPPGKNFTEVQSNDDDIWRYISVRVMPDITYLRYPDPEKQIKESGGRLNHKRFYAATRRIWLKTLWWYIHLSWQGTEEKTFEVLKDNGTDNINKLIETPGRGYRLPLFRSMMREYAANSPNRVKDFSAFTKLNNAKCVLVEPALTLGGVDAYAHKLFEELFPKGENNQNVK